MRKAIANITFKDGTFEIHNRKLFNELVKKISNGMGLLTVERVYNKTTNPMHGYYRGVVIPICCMGFNEVGYEYDLKQTHQVLKGLFLTQEMIDIRTGEVMGTYVPSMSETYTIDVMGYFDKIIEFGSSYLNVFIPEPDPDWRNKEKHSLDFYKIEL